MSEQRHDVIGGLAVAAAGLVLLAASFLVSNPVPLTVRGAVVIFTVVGFAVSFGFLPVLNPQDFYGGIALILLALIALVASNDLPGIHGIALGPGTAPRLFASALAVLSLGVVVTALVTKGPRATPFNIRSVVFVIGSILVFAASIRPLGLVIATFATVVTCAAAADDVKWRETVIWALILTAFCSVLFPYGLNLPFELWPRLW